MLASTLVLPSAAASSYTGSDNEQKVYEFAINKLGVNGAVASAILANIYSESGFRPTASAMESDGYISYGICQWHKGRYDALQSYCASNGLDYTTIEGQLEYLKYELENGERSAYNKIRGAENTAEGAYTASAPHSRAIRSGRSTAVKPTLRWSCAASHIPRHLKKAAISASTERSYRPVRLLPSPFEFSTRTAGLALTRA